jgi:hypothetical protein
MDYLCFYEIKTAEAYPAVLFFAKETTESVEQFLSTVIVYKLYHT